MITSPHLTLALLMQGRVLSWEFFLLYILADWLLIDLFDLLYVYSSGFHGVIRLLSFAKVTE